VFQILGVILTSDLSRSSHSAPSHENYWDFFTVGFTSMLNHQHYYTIIVPSKTPPRVCKRCLGSSPTETYSSLKNVQKFRLRICSKQWDLDYDELLSNFSVLTFSHVDYITSSAQCLRSYPSSVFVPRPMCSRFQSNVFFQPFAHANCFLHSLVPSTIPSWNSMPTNITNALTLPAFNKYCIHALIFCK